MPDASPRTAPSTTTTATTATTTAATSRRSVLRAGATAAGAAGVGATVLATTGRAEAAQAYRPARFAGDTPLLGARDRHLVTRFSYGLTPALARQVRRAGGGRAWFEQQLDAGSVTDGAGAFASWWPGLGRTPSELWQRHVGEVEGGWEVMDDYQRWLLLRRMHTGRQVHEVMTEFWENHLNVPVNGDAVFTWRADYGDTVRRHALGRFDELLQDAVVHPAMLLYLDGAISTAEHPNENLGRELLELHTVGRGQYDEDDVKASARILTGWWVDMWRTWAASYEPRHHAVGPVSVMDFSHPNADRDGRAVTRAYLTHLAHHPATAARIARKLAVKFVSDDPPQALVDELARVYLASDTAIVPVLRALVASEAFAGSAGAKVRDPGEDVVATYRALRVKVSEPPQGRAGDSWGANAVLWQCSDLGSTPMSWPRPDGAPLDNDSWSSSSRVVASFGLHYAMSGGWWPRDGMRYRTPRQWLPKASIRFDLLVDHLAQELLGVHSTAELLQACCEACDVRPGERITREHRLVKWAFQRLLTTFLDSPLHMTR
ncbi:DUF1800 domain-containing protein [Nocardioides kribbensis]|uniref:DUF1800 domain-containing protein n=1 Tax=Nocardioides kribbensis TaxID=305517 RepID=UPI0032DB487B